MCSGRAMTCVCDGGRGQPVLDCILFGDKRFGFSRTGERARRFARALQRGDSARGRKAPSWPYMSWAKAILGGAWRTATVTVQQG